MRIQPKPSEEGFSLLAVIFLLALLTLSLSIALPKVIQDLQRDREVEAFHRGMQYRRAIQLYYRKFHAYPPNLDALWNTNDIRYLRKKYVDPITGKQDWQPILFGQNKAPTAMGFFGQPLMGTTLAGTGPGGGAGLGSNGLLNSPGSNSGFGNSGMSSSGFGNSPGSIFGNPGPSGAGSNSPGGFGGDSGVSGSPGTGGASSGFGTPGGQTFGGAGIIGVTIPSEKQTILIYKKQSRFNQWEFVYDPIQDMQTNIPGGGGLNGSSQLPGGGATPGSPFSGGPPISPFGNPPDAQGPPEGAAPGSGPPQ